MGDASLSGWMRALIDYVRSGEPDLTNRQMALLMLVYLTPGPHTVRGLARMLGVSKPVVTRALNTLGALGYLRRERDQDDRRNVFVVRTSNGAEFLEGFKRIPPRRRRRRPPRRRSASGQGARLRATLRASRSAGPSNLPDPAIHAYRKDLADTALAGQVIASHYAEPLARHLVAGATLMRGAGDDAEPLAELVKPATNSHARHAAAAGPGAMPAPTAASATSAPKRSAA